MAGIAARGFVTWAGLGCATGLRPVGGFIMGAAEGTVFGATEGFVRGGLTTGTWAGAGHEAALGAGMGFLIGGPLGAIFHQVCFTAGTQVHSAAGNRLIEALRVGRRALNEETKDNAGEPGDDPTAVDPATWRLVRLQTAKPAGSDNLVDAELLRPLAWIEQSRAVVGSQIHFELAELGINGPADVLAIEPCPEIEPGRGRVITGTFTTARCQVLQLRLPNGEILEPTPPHRFYSETRKDWVAAQDLRVGECFRTRSGQAVTLESSGLKPGLHRVYNLEVEQEHQFYVGDCGVLVHNAYIGPYGQSPSPRTPGHQSHHVGQDASLETLAGYSRSEAPAIELFGGSHMPGSAHDAATTTQRQLNAVLAQGGATTMTIEQQATIAEATLRAAQAAPIQGPAGRITSLEIGTAMNEYWRYIASLGADPKTRVRIPGT